jgi:hypothetical protein
MTQDNVSDILDRVAAAYLSCTSYRDTGECTTVSITGPRPTDRHTSSLEFNTAFVRPDHFRFEYSDRGSGPRSEWSRDVVWRSPGIIQSWNTLDYSVEHFESLWLALAGPHGVSRGTATFTAHLLMQHGAPEMLDLGRHYLECDFGETLNVSTDDINGLTCQKLEASKPNEYGYQNCVWIDLATHLVVRIDTEKRFEAEEQRLLHEEELIRLRVMAKHDKDSAQFLEMFENDPPVHQDFTSEQTTIYRPELNCEIEREVFEFVPPGDDE